MECPVIASLSPVKQMKAEIAKLVAEMNEIEIKLDVYDKQGDSLAYGVWYNKYKSKDQECLNLMTSIEELERQAIYE